MQDTSSHALIDLLKVLAVPLAAGIGALGQWLFNRQKRQLEASVNEATAVKTRAEARKLDGETLNMAWDRIDELTAINSELRTKVDLCEIRSRHHETQQKKMKALLDLHGIKYSEFDEPRS